MVDLDDGWLTTAPICEPHAMMANCNVWYSPFSSCNSNNRDVMMQCMPPHDELGLCMTYPACPAWPVLSTLHICRIYSRGCGGIQPSKSQSGYKLHKEELHTNVSHARLGLTQAVQLLPGLLPQKRGTCAPAGLQSLKSNLLVVGSAAALGTCNHWFTALDCQFDVFAW